MIRKLSLVLCQVAAAGLFVGLAAWTSIQEPPKDLPANALSATKNLYERLGGADGIATVIDDFVPRLAADKRITANQAVAESLKRVSVPGLKFKLTAQVCEATGGPWTYGGKDMPIAHAGLHISEDEWIAAVEDLKESLTKFNVPTAEQDELIGIIATTHDEVVGHVGKPRPAPTGVK